jgi:small conductance mechanosensitive channel
MSTPDNVHMVVPNGKIFNDVIKNFSINDTRRIDITVGIGYTDPIDRAMEVLLDVMKSEARIIQEPEPQIVVTELADSSVNLLVRCWTKRTDFWPVKCDLTKNIKENLDIQGIEIPFPQRTVHMISD